MLSVLAHPVYARLFAAQAAALAGTGLLTIALGLLAYDLAGARAGVVMGTVLAIKMIAYVFIAPLMNALVARLPRKLVLIAADLARALAALAFPFVDAAWQAYLLIFALQLASATFTPAFQATIPDILEDEAEYTKALSLSRLAYDLENLLSPMLAAALLLVVGSSALFLGTVAGFIVSALLVQSAALPRRRAAPERPFKERLTRGARIYLATPRLRGLLAVSAAGAAVSAFVLVNTVVLVGETYGGDERDVAIAFAAFGAGSMIAALALPRLLEARPDRPIMLAAAGLLSALCLLTAAAFSAGAAPGWPAFLCLWALIGLFYSAALTPSGRLLRRSAQEVDRPDVFTAQFALSHACWLIAYPLAGWVGAEAGMAAALWTLGGLAALAALAAPILWRRDESVLHHEHPDLPADHPHLQAHGRRGHAHVFVIDDEHRVWPTRG